jgi:hypothetical protein
MVGVCYPPESVPQVDDIGQFFLVLDTYLHETLHKRFVGVLFDFELFLFVSKQVFELLSVDFKHRASDMVLVGRLLDELEDVFAGLVHAYSERGMIP